MSPEWAEKQTRRCVSGGVDTAAAGSAIALGLWVGLVSQFIPVIGTYIAGVVPALIAVGVDPRKALFVVIAVLIYQQIENYVLQPRVTAQTLDMHPAVAFAAVLAGTATFGVTGALLALPFLATVQSFISAYVARHTVVDSYLLSTEIPHVVRSRHHNDEQDHEDSDRDERQAEDLSQGDG